MDVSDTPNGRCSQQLTTTTIDITELRDGDVITGQPASHHPGTKQFRSQILQHQTAYGRCYCAQDKTALATKIVRAQMRKVSPPARFLEKVVGSPTQYIVLKKKRAIEKTERLLKHTYYHNRKRERQQQQAPPEPPKRPDVVPLRPTDVILRRRESLSSPYHHPGNREYHLLIQHCRTVYDDSLLDRPLVLAKDIVDELQRRTPNVRFVMEFDHSGSKYYLAVPELHAIEAIATVLSDATYHARRACQNIITTAPKDAKPECRVEGKAKPGTQRRTSKVVIPTNRWGQAPYLPFHAQEQHVSVTEAEAIVRFLRPASDGNISAAQDEEDVQGYILSI